MIQIPTFQQTSADFNQEIELGGQLVQLQIIWNSRNEFFHLRFTDQNGNVIYGLKIVPNWPILDQHKGFTDFQGDFLVLKDDEDAESVITYDNFGSGWNLYFGTEDEIDQWKVDSGL
jgi:hypothetical protein